MSYSACNNVCGLLFLAKFPGMISLMEDKTISWPPCMPMKLDGWMTNNNVIYNELHCICWCFSAPQVTYKYDMHGIATKKNHCSIVCVFSSKRVNSNQSIGNDRNFHLGMVTNG